ncbi:MAG: response regulator [Gammaproteobacteria bacterium]|nr:response regulator [Gammaproteobacteria bacterium]
MPGTIEPVNARYVTFARLTGLLTVAAGMLVLAGWVLDIASFKSQLPGWATMKPNTALCFTLAGVSLWLKCIDQTPLRTARFTKTQASHAIGGVVALLALLTLSQDLFNLNLGIDNLLFMGQGAPSFIPPGRMAPMTAFNFLLLGSVLALIDDPVTSRACEWLTVLVLLFGSVAILGYLYGVEALYRTGPYASMALLTAILFTILASGVLAARPTLGFMRALTSPLAGGMSARRLIPWVLIAPVVLGWLRLWGQREGFYGTEFGLALYTVSNILVLVCVVYWSARSLNASDVIRWEQHARELQTNQLLLENDVRWRLAVTNAGLGVWHWYADSGEMEWSDRRYALFGMAAGSPITFEGFLAQVFSDDRKKVEDTLRTALRDCTEYRCEYRIILPDGSERWVASWGNCNFDAQRQTNRIDGVVLDITARKRAEQLLLGQNRVLQRVAAGAPLPDALNELLRVVESRTPGMLTSILLADDSGTHLRHVAAPSLPAEYCLATDSVKIGSGVGSCGTAAYRHAAVIVSDIQTDPLWVNYRELAARFGLRACWSTPIINANGRVLGTFAMYYRTPSCPEPAHEEVIELATQTAIHVIEHQHVVDAIRTSETRYRTLGDNIPDVIARYDRSLHYVYVNRAIEAATGIPADKFLDKTFTQIGIPQAQIDLWTATLRRVFETGEDQRVEFDYPSPGGTHYWEGLAVAERDMHGEIESVLTISRDITARKLAAVEHSKLEAQLRQSHKLQALGTLAGGIAHDFNNLLMAISGNATLARTKIPSGGPVHKYLGEIEKASARATDLVKRILAFSRPQGTDTKPLQLQPVIEDALQLLRSTIPATIQIRTSFSPASSNIIADASQVHQVLMNLGTNAAHAMRGYGGTLDVQLTSVMVDAALARTSPHLREGSYECVTVTDSGTGMDAETLERIFDPFYTTKGVGEGTGLGLSVVHGIMRGHGGAITVKSRPQQGTTFSLYFPATTQIISGSVMPAAVTASCGMRERVLLVDDESALVFLLTQILEHLNFQISGETDATAALAKFSAHPHDFDVLVTDLAMPGLSGFDLVRAIRKIRPELPVIVTTGYIRPEDADTARNLGIQHLILKPNTVKELGHALLELFNVQKDMPA